MKGKLFKGGLTVLGAVVISTLGIFASDSLQGIDRDLVGLAGVGTEGICRKGMVPMKYDGNTLCIDIYEASPSKNCPHSAPENTYESEENANNADCYAAVIENSVPWRYVSLPQAQRMCAGAGKRLPTSEEWYRIALGTNPEACTINKTSFSESKESECISSIGAFNTVGNVWEWVDAEIVGNTYHDRTLPPEGYVASVDSSGVAITSSEKEEELYGADYFWSKNEGVFGMIRGGFYGSNSDAGLYAINASVQTSFASQGVGFRCVEDIM